MSNRTKAKAIALDIGTAVRRARGDVVIEDAPDPDAPNRTVRRARVAWAPDVLLAKGTIRLHHHAAARRLMDSYEVGILGARDRSLIFVSRSGAPGGMADAALAAATDYREATQAVGMALSDVLVWCVLGSGTLGGYAAKQRWPADRATGYLVAALDRLSEHFDMG